MNISKFKLLALFLSISISSCDREASSSYFRDADFNAQWLFYMGDINDPSKAGEDKSGWIPVHLPHDWSIIDYAVQDSLHEGPFYKNLPGGVDVGYLRNGTAWYRKEFISPNVVEGKQIILGFDGVQSQMELWVNGILTGEHIYGYTPFQFDIAPALKGPGEKNLILVKNMVPKKIFFTKGVGRHKHELQSFELALRNASIEKCNLVKVSSIVPPGCKIIF